jgi:hypothetical protein
LPEEYYTQGRIFIGYIPSMNAYLCNSDMSNEGVDRNAMEGIPGIMIIKGQMAPEYFNIIKLSDDTLGFYHSTTLFPEEVRALLEGSLEGKVHSPPPNNVDTNSRILTEATNPITTYLLLDQGNKLYIPSSPNYWETKAGPLDTFSTSLVFEITTPKTFDGPSSYRYELPMKELRNVITNKKSIYLFVRDLAVLGWINSNQDSTRENAWTLVGV